MIAIVVVTTHSLGEAPLFLGKIRIRRSRGPRRVSAKYSSPSVATWTSLHRCLGSGSGATWTCWIDACLPVSIRTYSNCAEGRKKSKPRHAAPSLGYPTSAKPPAMRNTSACAYTLSRGATTARSLSGCLPAYKTCMCQSLLACLPACLAAYCVHIR